MNCFPYACNMRFEAGRLFYARKGWVPLRCCAANNAVMVKRRGNMSGAFTPSTHTAKNTYLTLKQR